VRLYSTPQSALAGEVTVLAIIETIAATAFSVWLVVHRGTLTHVVIGACVAPFLLLRTDQATKSAFSMAEQYQDFADEFSSVPSILLIVFGIPIIRPLALTISALRHPIKSVRAIPVNWNRMVWATDLYCPPEILPELETSTTPIIRDEAFRFTTLIATVRQEFKHGDLSTAVFLATVGLIWYIPALAYRYSLKATALIYLPAIWVLHDSLVEVSGLQHKLEDIKDSQIERLKRWYSAFVLLFLVIIPFIIYLTKQEWLQELTTWMQHTHPAIIALLSAFLPTAPTGLEIRGWHLARSINATLTILLFIWADGKMRQIARGTFEKTGAAVARLNLWLLVRGILTLYIIGCTIYIVAAAVNWKGLWPIHVKWFPWS